ncbi:MAG TPA: isoprenyl transferase [Planktothrix sp.]|jgi:undecaprenyl diphosphate synthase
MPKSFAKPSSRIKDRTRAEHGQVQEAEPLPLEHVAIIMDGNRRWADLRHLPRLVGHKEGVKSLKQLVKHVSPRGLKYLTVYAFSSENWQRSQEEVSYLFELFANVLRDETDELSDNNVRLSFIGDLSQVPTKLRQKIDAAMEKTSRNTGLRLQVAINYGSRLEISHAARQISIDVASGKLKPEQITEDLFAKYLYTRELPDPELMIRTGGEMRLSNYLLWQSAYTELYITDVLWPEFGPESFEKAIAEFTRRVRRYGGD